MITTTDALTEWPIVMATAVLAMLPPVCRGRVCSGCSCAGWSRRKSKLMANVTLRDVRKAYPERLRGHQGRRCRCRRRTVLRAGRPVRLRQVDAAADGRGAGDDHPRRDRHRRPHRQPDRAGRSRHRDGVPELRALSAYERLQQHGLRPAQSRHAKPEIDTRVQEAARILELTPMLERKPRQLSGGQRQRVAMGRAIVRQPKVFLFDEPLSNLDAKLRIAMRVEIRKLQRRLSTTSIYVTHDQLEAMTLADILVVMNGGQVEQIGNPLDIYQKPATTFVASFIGAPPMNLMPLRRRLTSQLAGDSRATAGILGIRPEDLSISRRRAGRRRRARPHGRGDRAGRRGNLCLRQRAQQDGSGRQRQARRTAARRDDRAGSRRRRARDRRADQGGRAARQAASVQRRRPPADRA